MVWDAIEYAIKYKRKSVTLVHKGNIMKFTEGSFKKRGYEISEKKFSEKVFTWSKYNKIEKEFGKHPTQKPLQLLDYIIKASTNEKDLVLDPFAGSGTTLKMAKQNSRDYIGIEMSEEYIEIIRKRLEQDAIQKYF